MKNSLPVTTALIPASPKVASATYENARVRVCTFCNAVDKVCCAERRPEETFANEEVHEIHWVCAAAVTPTETVTDEGFEPLKIRVTKTDAVSAELEDI